MEIIFQKVVDKSLAEGYNSDKISNDNNYQLRKYKERV